MRETGKELGRDEELLGGQEVGTLTYLVLQSGMYPHPVYIPTGEIRELRALLSQRRALHADYQRLRSRGRAYLRAAGCPAAAGIAALRPALARASGRTEGCLADGIGLCRRQEATLRAELQRVDAALGNRVASIDAVQRLMTIPGIGVLVATAVYAWVGDVRRFPTAKKLAAYAGLVPTVRQSGTALHVGGITKQGAPRCGPGPCGLLAGRSETSVRLTYQF